MTLTLIFKLFHRLAFMSPQQRASGLGQERFSLEVEHPVELHLVVPFPSLWLGFWRTSPFNLAWEPLTRMGSAGDIWFAARQVPQEFCKKSLANESQSFPLLGLESESSFSEN